MHTTEHSVNGNLIIYQHSALDGIWREGRQDFSLVKAVRLRKFLLDGGEKILTQRRKVAKRRDLESIGWSTKVWSQGRGWHENAMKSSAFSGRLQGGQSRVDSAEKVTLSG
jgi:hypothetical protein